MKTSNKGISFIKSFESCHLTAYKCPSGVWTIGYGHTSGVKEGQSITQTQADAFLEEDLAKFEKYVINTGLVLNQNQFDALVSFTYNCGNGNLKKLIKNRTLAEIAEALLLYNKSNGKVLTGLVRRREAERELFLAEVENMAVKIGHASIDENKNIKNGTAGDQTGSEVCTRSWYSKPWPFVLRPKSAALAEKSAVACEQACANAKIGYDQNQRNTLHTQALKVGFDLSKITTACECDCSSLMHVCALAGGANIPYGTKGAATNTMKSRFTVNGDYEALTNSKYLTSDLNLKRGDILVKPGSHTVMVLEDGAVANGTAEYSQEQFIREVQNILGAKIDGIGGPETLSKTITVSTIWNRKHAVVKPIQKYLNFIGYNCGTADGIAGAKFKAAVKLYQKDVVKASTKNQDGVITKKGATWKKLLGIS